ncbi:hypothetical protein [Roseovarius sp. Pro17]|uniref:hypothetical protein n=1 Tax=Roseovarius sp. Pro17 TaxID=3108175 RepID=UPI002D767434|nr:hypothetical protein [Roseovarius sp. Pro17]
MTSFAFVLRKESLGMPSAGGRYEYRVWPRRALPAISDLHRDWTLEFAEKRADIYLLGAHAMPELVKLRNGTRLEIKRRGRDHMGLQYWQVALSQDFLLVPSALDQLAATFALSEALPSSAGLSPAHLVANLLRPPNRVKARIVQKSRLLFRRGTCVAEITHVRLDQRSWMTVAVEDPDPSSAAQAVDDLGLRYLPNQSYADFLLAEPLLIAEPSLDR